MAERSKFAKSLQSPYQWIGAILILMVVLVPLMLPKYHERPHASHVIEMAWTIDRLLLAYAIDHNDTFPDGKSSTEVFQKLLDEKYCADPAIFYITMPEKTKPTSRRLEPKNVSWDVTISNDTNYNYFPVVFLTGYKINYVPGGSATRLSRVQTNHFEGIAVGYYGNGTFRMDDGLPDGAVTNFISSDFNPTGKTYQQLTPDGPLPPK